MTSVTRAVPAVAAGRDGREAAADASSVGCEQVIVHTEHTLGLLPRCVFYAIKLSLSIF